MGLRAEERHKLLQSVADYIYDCLVLQRNKSALKWFHWGNRWGSFVSCLYFTIKVLYLVNVIGQLSLLYSFLGAQDQWWGFHLFQNLLAGRDWQQSQAFPRVTLCEYYVSDNKLNCIRDIFSNLFF